MPGAQLGFSDQYELARGERADPDGTPGGRQPIVGGDAGTRVRRGSAVRTEVEVIAFHSGDKSNTVGARASPAGESCVAVGGLVYAHDRNVWAFRGIKEAYVKKMLDLGYHGIGQVLAIGEADARLIQRNLHASVGRPSLQVTGVCSGMVARKLRQYLRYVGIWGTPFGAPGVLPTPPLYDDDLGKQVNTRGWVMKRVAYSPPQASATAPRSLGSRILDSKAYPRPAPIAWTPPSELTPTREFPSTSGLSPERALGTRRVRSGLSGPVPDFRSGGPTIAGGAVRDEGRRLPAPKPGARVSAVLAETPVPKEARPTVKMQLRPPSRPRAVRLRIMSVSRGEAGARQRNPRGEA